MAKARSWWRGAGRMGRGEKVNQEKKSSARIVAITTPSSRMPSHRNSGVSLNPILSCNSWNCLKNGFFKSLNFHAKLFITSGSTAKNAPNATCQKLNLNARKSARSEEHTSELQSQFHLV